jgi:glycosyltransferase involved in cell wall biosynthesis
LKKKKIFFVVPTIKHGGAELFLLRLCSIAQVKFDITVVVIGQREGLYADFENLQIRMHYLGYQSVFLFPFALFRLRRLIRKESPAVIQSFLYSADIVSGLASLSLEVPLRIWSLRGTELASDTRSYKIGIQKFAAKLSDHLPDVIISCSDQVTKFHSSLGYPPEKIITIGNFVSRWTQNLDSNSVFLNEAHPEHFTIGLAARYDLGKGHHSLADAVIEFLRNNPSVSITLSFAGKGCETEGRLYCDLQKNESLTQLTNLGRVQVETVGLLMNEEISQWFQKLDLYFMASDSLEGFPNSLAEAVAIGLPSVATPVGAAVDFLSKDRIADSPSPNAMSDLLQNFYELNLFEKQNVTLQLRSQILQRFAENKILSLYTSVWINGISQNQLSE